VTLNQIILTLTNIFGLATVFNYIEASRKYPGEDPRRTVWNLSNVTMWLRLLIIGLVFIILLILMKNLNLMIVYQIASMIIYILTIVYLLYILKPFGWNRKKS
jgi:hypothetical protein